MLVLKISAKARPIILTAFLLVDFSSNLSAQASDFGNWMSYFMTGKFNERWAVVGDYQLREYDAFTDLQQVLLRTFVQYSINDRLSVSCGYAFAVNGLYADEGKVFLNENRPTQQLVMRWRKERFWISARLRTEQRFIENADMLFRYRLFGSCLWQLRPSSSWAIAATEEYFMYLNGSGFDQNRIFLGLSHRFNERFRLETGALWITRSSSDRWQLFTQLVHTFDW